MIEDIVNVAGLRLGPGTLYGAISRLESRGLIEAMKPENRRNPYRLTGAGERSLRERLRSLAAVTRAGEERLAAV
jgi:DNA-binding PadR family transcriptional regulator